MVTTRTMNINMSIIISFFISVSLRIIHKSQQVRFCLTASLYGLSVTPFSLSKRQPEISRKEIFLLIAPKNNQQQPHNSIFNISATRRNSFGLK